MEGISATVYKGIREYWRRKGYQRLNGTGRNQKPKIFELGSTSSADGSTRRRRFCRIKLTPRLKLKFRFSPKKFILSLRDAYVTVMVKLASSRMIAGGLGGGYPGDGGVAGLGIRPMKEYDEKMIVEIYKSVVAAQGNLVPRDAAWVGSQITCRR